MNHSRLSPVGPLSESDDFKTRNYTRSSRAQVLIAPASKFLDRAEEIDGDLLLSVSHYVLGCMGRNVSEIRAGAGQGKELQPPFLGIGAHWIQKDAPGCSRDLDLTTRQAERLRQPHGL